MEIGYNIPQFHLKGVDEKLYSIKDFNDKNILVLAFLCNHCPYVKAYEERLINIQEKYQSHSVQLIGINSNDSYNYPEDSYEAMIKRAKDRGFNFPYLCDETQEVAHQFGATHTPQIFVFNSDRKLVYIGSIDDNWLNPNAVRDHLLIDVIEALLDNKAIKRTSTYVVGCTIKWAH